MENCAELEMSLSNAGVGQYALRYRFTRPADPSVSHLGLRERALVALDVARLRAQPNPESYGGALSEMLFADPLALSGFSQARAAAETLKVPLRVRLDIDPSDAPLHALRWETLLDPERRTRLCADESVLFSRFLSSARQQSFPPPGLERLRAVALIASPSDIDAERFAPLDIPAELERARQALADMDVIYLAGGGKATLDNLLAALREDRGADVLYLVAHGWQAGSKSYVLLENAEGKRDPVTVSELVGTLSGVRRLPLLSVLVSCQSAGTGATGGENVLLALGPQLAELGIPAVMAMQGSITFPTIEAFMPLFFKELRRDGQIDRAIAVARARVRGMPDWWMPVLFSRLRDNQLFRPTTLERQPFEPETVYIAAGRFLMGRDPAPGVPSYETPAHEINLPAYRIGRYPVTNRQYAEFVRQTGQEVNPEAGWNGQSPLRERIDHPMVGVTWYQAMAYCEWLSEQTSRRYTLPNEAQWEKAARGEGGCLYPWGSEWQAERCNADLAQITPVRQYPPQNEYGVVDMIGNAREWTLSLWGERRSSPDFLYPWTPENHNDPHASELVRRVFRGGAGETPEEMTCTARGSYAPDKSGPTGQRHGFRVVLLESGS